MKLFRFKSGASQAQNGASESPSALKAKLLGAVTRPETTVKPHKKAPVLHADPGLMDQETLALYLDAQQAADELREEAGDEARADALASGPRSLTIQSPLKLGFTVTIGVLLALLFGAMVDSLGTVIMWVVAALFIALGLDPMVRALERRGLRRPLGILVVFGSFAAALAVLLSIIIPMITVQVTQFVRTLPYVIRDISYQDWYSKLQQTVGDFVDLDALLLQGQRFLTDPTKWSDVVGGIWKAGIGIVSGVTATFIIFILSLYFLASLRSMKRALYICVARSSRARVIDITEQISRSVGGYVVGMVIIALTNAVLGFIMMSIVGVPFAALVAVGVFILAFIPLIGSMLATVLVTLMALINSPVTALIALIYYLVYMQIEAYVLSPRIMSRVVKVPGALVVIGALAGGTLLGLLGALLSIPVTASILMVIRQVWIPRQDSR